jgi:fibronectin-binding autotransporter adhesin
MAFFTWPRTRKRSSFGQPGKRTTFRPQLEALEDRWVPSMLKVTNTFDSGPGSLRYEIAHANNSGKDTIVFDKSLLGRTINLYTQLNIDAGVKIQGPGAGLLTLTTNYNFGDPWGQSMRVFEVNASRPVVLSGLTISDNGGTDEGGAVLNYSTLTITGCNISNNGSVSYGGGIANFGTLTLSGSTLSSDGAVFYGGAIYNAGTLAVSGCTLSFDGAYGFGSPIGPGSGIYNVGTLTVSTSTFVWDDISGSYTDGGGNTFITAAPQIGSFTASSSSVTAGSSLTLTATNITDANPGASITELMIYVNGWGGTPFGYATQSSPGVWTFTFSTAGWVPGTYAFYAMAVDSYGTFGGVVATTVQVT